MQGFFIFFMTLLILATLIVTFIYTNSTFECALPHGGYLKIQWNKNQKKFDILYWQPKKNENTVKTKDILHLEGKPKVKKPKAFF